MGGDLAGRRLQGCGHACHRPALCVPERMDQGQSRAGGFMRPPPEAPYVYALECAMDELALKLGIDPVERRRINDTTRYQGFALYQPLPDAVLRRGGCGIRLGPA